jgi:hypothetical protein
VNHLVHAQSLYHHAVDGEWQRCVHVNSVNRVNSVSRVSPMCTLAASVSLNSWLTTPDWLELANDAFYMISSAVFQNMAQH